MLGRLCCVNFRLPGVGFCRSGVRYRRLGVRCPLPVRVSSLNLSALRARNFRLNGDWDACAAGNFTCRAGEHLSALLPFGYGISPSGEDGTPVRRAARWGRLWGCAPFAAPLASPPKHPRRGLSASLVLRGHAARAAGASFPRYAQSGDLPPRRVNAIVRFRFGQNPLQPNTQLCFMHLSRCGGSNYFVQEMKNTPPGSFPHSSDVIRGRLCVAFHTSTQTD